MEEPTPTTGMPWVSQDPPIQHDDDLLEIVKMALMGKRPSAKDTRRLVDAGYIYRHQSMWIVSQSCIDLIWKSDPEFMQSLHEQADRDLREESSAKVQEAAELNGLLEHRAEYSRGYRQDLSFMTGRGRTVDGLQLLHALTDPDMPFITMAVQFDRFPDIGLPHAAMQKVLHDGKQEWIQMRERILAGLTDEERILVGLPVTEKLSESAEQDQPTESPPPDSEANMEEKVKGLILDTARRLKRARDRAHGRPPDDGWW